jgi:hypothetical protein
VSNSFVGARDREQAYGFEGLVNEIIYSHETGLLKPDPRIFAMICERLEVVPRRNGLPRQAAVNAVSPERQPPSRGHCSGGRLQAPSVPMTGFGACAGPTATASTGRSSAPSSAAGTSST